jgi:hypothetical protein
MGSAVEVGVAGFHKRRDRLAETIEAMIATFAFQSPGWHDDLLLVDSTPVECAPLRQRIESIYWSAKDILDLERHGARTLRGLRARIASRLLALAAAISLNYELQRNSRALVDYVA